MAADDGRGGVTAALASQAPGVPATRTATGGEWPLSEALPAAVDLPALARALGHLPMFGGHTPIFYSMAQHLVNVANRMAVENRLNGLIWRTGEALIGTAGTMADAAMEQSFREVGKEMGYGAAAGPIIWREGRRRLIDMHERAIHIATGCQWPPSEAVHSQAAYADFIVQQRANELLWRGDFPPEFPHPLRPHQAGDLWLFNLREELDRRGWPTPEDKARQ